jgi:hypothetical protein
MRTPRLREMADRLDRREGKPVTTSLGVRTRPTDWLSRADSFLARRFQAPLEPSLSNYRPEIRLQS